MTAKRLGEWAAGVLEHYRPNLRGVRVTTYLSEREQPDSTGSNRDGPLWAGSYRPAAAPHNGLAQRRARPAQPGEWSDCVLVLHEPTWRALSGADQTLGHLVGEALREWLVLYLCAPLCYGGRRDGGGSQIYSHQDEGDQRRVALRSGWTSRSGVRLDDPLDALRRACGRAGRSWESQSATPLRRALLGQLERGRTLSEAGAHLGKSPAEVRKSLGLPRMVSHKSPCADCAGAASKARRARSLGGAVCPCSDGDHRWGPFAGAPGECASCGGGPVRTHERRPLCLPCYLREHRRACGCRRWVEVERAAAGGEPSAAQAGG